MVDDILRDLGLSTKPRILVLNKIDLLEPNEDTSESEIQEAVGKGSRAVFTSATSGQGIPELKRELQELLTEVEGPPAPVHV